MIEVLAVFVAIGLALALLNCFYWYGLYPMLHRRVQFQLYACRDSLRRLAVEKKVAPSCSAYRFAEQNICVWISNLDAVTFCAFWKFFASGARAQNCQKIQQFCREAPDEVPRIWRRAAITASNMILINSPVTVCLILYVLPVVALCKGVKLLFAAYDDLQAFIATGIPAHSAEARHGGFTAAHV